MDDGPGLAPSACLPLDSGVGGTPPSALSCFSAFVLDISFWLDVQALDSLLELVGCSLPIPSKLDSHLDTSIHIFLAALIIDTQLEYIAVLLISLCLSSRPVSLTLIGVGLESVLGLDSRM